MTVYVSLHSQSGSGLRAIVIGALLASLTKRPARDRLFSGRPVALRAGQPFTVPVHIVAAEAIEVGAVEHAR